jgi:hypothetical protein
MHTWPRTAPHPQKRRVQTFLKNSRFSLEPKYCVWCSHLAMLHNISIYVGAVFETFNVRGQPLYIGDNAELNVFEGYLGRAHMAISYRSLTHLSALLRAVNPFVLRLLSITTIHEIQFEWGFLRWGWGLTFKCSNWCLLLGNLKNGVFLKPFVPVLMRLRFEESVTKQLF